MDVKVGNKFGRLEIKEIYLKKYKSEGKNRSFCWCLCDCGNYKEIRLDGLKSGATKSCGCLQKEIAKQNKSSFKHGKSGGKNKLYEIWYGLKQRCLNPNGPSWKYYGGRGIAVCEEWKNNYLKFEEWALSNGYKKGLTIDRIDNNGNYCPRNCRWVTRKEQANNRSSNVYLTVFGETKTMLDWFKDERCKVKIYKTLKSRIEYGWSHEEAITKPNHRKTRDLNK